VLALRQAYDNWNIFGRYPDRELVWEVVGADKTEDYYEVNLYPNMLHGWMNSTIRGRYRADEAEKPWDLIIRCLNRVHSREFPRERVIWCGPGAQGVGLSSPG
jgi:hypothetical protein